MGDRRGREASPANGGGKPLQAAEAQGRYRHETRPERHGAEQGVKRLRKPEDAAQPGMETRCRSLLLASSVVGHQTPWKGRSSSPLLAVEVFGHTLAVVSEREDKGMRGVA